ncbi:phosphosulfolactate synthase [Rhodosalinus sp. K401]|uniref:phosphosulfolactate synthase n=1 Tax=Rhodosalinus sp. K401 TaxID=3239195 RepID=UPI003525620F
MPLTRAIALIPLEKRRSLGRLRNPGVKMLSDREVSLPALTWLLDVAVAYIDVVRITRGTACVFPREYLMEKLALLFAGGVRSLLVGQIQEYALPTMALPQCRRSRPKRAPWVST